ncbi:sensor histidine kinase [Haloimpatiens sp. FM7330]|uniref:sensor histidine kinase n=1 Tax=Haloimpatiens sp. FM7330 TaxID=3298610 RepID=UPI003625C127
MKESIKKRLVINFMLIILVTVVILEILLINTIKQYYYYNVEETLTNQIKLSSDFYSRYFSNSSLKDNILNNVDVFWKQTSAQVQIIDTNGTVLMDSIGLTPQKPITDSAFKKALNGSYGKWIGEVPYDTSNVLAVTYPLKSNNKIVGVLRFITSLKNTNKEIMNISFIFILIGTIAVIISAIFSIFLSNTIIGPLKEVTKVAEKMAKGDFKLRTVKHSNDELGKLSDTLNYMADEIVKKDQLKNEFISSVSHELRTPLTSIKGWAITLKMDELEDKQLIRDGLDIIENESERLTGMVEELLDFSKFVSGKIKLSKKETDITKIMQYIGKHMNPRATRDNISFIINYPENIPLMLIDENRIKQVLINVVDNAFKFTSPNGKVSINAVCEDKYLTLCIEDTGCGISSDELPKVKEKFYKGKTSKSQNGIGLSICDEIIKLHNGLFIIESQINVGTKVYIKLPL